MTTNEELDNTTPDNLLLTERLSEESEEASMKQKRKRKSQSEEAVPKENFPNPITPSPEETSNQFDVDLIDSQQPGTDPKIVPSPRVIITNCSDQSLPLELKNGDTRWVSRGSSINIPMEMVSVVINRFAMKGLITIK